MLCALQSQLAHGQPQLDWGREVGARPSPSWEYKITISNRRAFSPSYGGLFLHMNDLFSPFGGHCFSLCTVLGAIFSTLGTIYLLMWKVFHACSHLQKLLRAPMLWQLE